KDGLVDPPLRNYYRNLSSLDSHRLALLTSAFLERGRTREARVVAERLWQQAEQTQSVISWKGREDWGRGGDSETTALAFQALCTLDPRDDRLFKIARWFVLQRQGNHWVSTRDTSFALLALTSFLEHSQELQPDYQASVALNGKPLLERRFTREHLFDPEVEVKAPAGALRQGDNTLTLRKAGPGNLYYTIIFRQFVGQEDLPKVVGGSGISVRRAYYPLVTERTRRTGVITPSPAPKPTTDLRSGQQILVKLTIDSPREYEFVVVEDPIPAGCEVAERVDVEPWEWDRWWSDMDVRDEKVAVFARRLPAGVSTIEYYLAPQIPGEYHVMPTQVYAMYNPELRGSGAETRVRLR
ncbi:MAG: hypothetical protein MUQ26_05840, partial [Armatimonadetes bacterium]|nr:hypothetical protein [Armatimonadota bacterium]